MVTCILTRIASHEPIVDGSDQGRFARTTGNSRVRGAPITCRSAMRLSLACLVAFLGAASAMVPIQALGTVIDVALDPSKFGKLDQAKTTCPDTNCGPTAAVNSLVYLQNMFPTTYKVPLVPSGKEVDTANILSGKDFMGTCCVTGGTEIGDFILGKMAYIEATDPRVTTYEAEMRDQWITPAHPDAQKPGFVQDNTVPDISFIAKQLSAQEDVEIAVKGTTGPGHFLTLTGIMFDTDSRTGKMFFVDPMGGKAGSVAIRQLDSSIITDYFISDELPTRIVGVIAESPVPEPATVLLLGSAFIMLGCAAWKRRRCPIWAPPSHQPRYLRRPRRSLAPSGRAFLPDRPATSLRPIAAHGPLARGNEMRGP